MFKLSKIRQTLFIICLSYLGISTGSAFAVKPAAAPTKPQTVQVNTDFEPLTVEQVNAIATDAYLYAYPMVLMEISKRVMTNVDKPTEMAAPINQFAQARKFPDATFTDVVRPNADTLYSSLWFDVSSEPLVLEIPATDGRYYLMPMLDMWTDIFASPGSRTTGNDKQVFVIANQEWQGTLPAGVNLIRSPTNSGWVIGRIKTDGPEDYPNVWKIQDEIKATPLSSYGQPYKAPAGVVNPQQAMIAPSQQVAQLQGEDFFRMFCEILKNNRPHQNDYPILEQLSRIGIEPGKTFNVTDPVILQAIAAAPAKAQALIESSFKTAGSMVNGWRINYLGIGTYGTYYLGRASVAFAGLGANTPEDAMYPSTFADQNGKEYASEKKYRLHFAKNQIPPVNGFWSLTMYNSKQFFADNPINRYAIGDRNKLKFNSDGSLDIYIQRESPGKDKESNWLPAPIQGPFTMNLRLYWPKSAALDKSWNPPAVMEVK